MTSKYTRRAETSPRFTRLETAVMGALAHDLRRSVPDLAGQFEEARPGQRRNTAFGLYSEMIVDRSRPTLSEGPTGRFGTVHAMIAGLPESVAFQVELRHGRLLALHADSYGQDTRNIDFAAVQPSEIFTVDDTGRSIPYQPAALMRESPLRALQRHTDHIPQDPEPPRLVNVGALQRVQEVERPVSAVSPVARAFDYNPAPKSDLDDIPAPEDQKSLLLGLWVAIGAVAILAVMLFNVPFPLAMFLAFFAGRAVKTPKVLDAIAALLKQAQEKQALKAKKP